MCLRTLSNRAMNTRIIIDILFSRKKSAVVHSCYKLGKLSTKGSQATMPFFNINNSRVAELPVWWDRSGKIGRSLVSMHRLLYGSQCYSYQVKSNYMHILSFIGNPTAGSKKSPASLKFINVIFNRLKAFISRLEAKSSSSGSTTANFPRYLSHAVPFSAAWKLQIWANYLNELDNDKRDIASFANILITRRYPTPTKIWFAERESAILWWLQSWISTATVSRVQRTEM